MKDYYKTNGYQRKSSEFIHQIVDSYETMDKTELMKLLQELRDICTLEVFYPLTKAMRESKEINKIEFDNYLKMKKMIKELEDDEHEELLKDLDYEIEEILNAAE